MVERKGMRGDEIMIIITRYQQRSGADFSEHCVRPRLSLVFPSSLPGVFIMNLQSFAPLLRAVGLSAALFLTAGAAQAQHLHAGDVELGLAGGVIVVDPEGLAERAANGYALFEGDFRDFAGGLFSTDDPGFISEQDSLPVGAIIRYRGLGALQSWDGAAWSTAASGVTLGILDVLGTNTLFSSTGVTDPVGAIAQVSGAGDIHSHLDFHDFR
jgi:hypothetical protein